MGETSWPATEIICIIERLENGTKLDVPGRNQPEICNQLCKKCYSGSAKLESANDYHIINGVPSVMGDTRLLLFLTHGKKGIAKENISLGMLFNYLMIDFLLVS